MADVDLRFAQAPGSADLLFGGEQTGPAPPIDAILNATLPGLIFSARAIPNANVALAVSLPAMVMIAEGKYQSYAVRPTVGQRTADWQVAGGFTTGIEERRQSTQKDGTLAGARWAMGDSHLAFVPSLWLGALARLPAWNLVAHQEADRLSPGGLQAFYSDTCRLRLSAASNYQEAQRAGWLRWEVFHQDGLRDKRRQTVSGFTTANRHAGVRLHDGIRTASHQRFWLRSFYQLAIVPPPGVHPSGPVKPPKPVPCYAPSGDLLFANLAMRDGKLFFVCEASVGPSP